jgi:putative transposase
MPRQARRLRGDIAYHVVNQGHDGRSLFHTVGDYHIFHRTLVQALKRYPVTLHAHAVLPDRWHLVISASNGDGKAISRFMHWLTVTHCHRLRARRGGLGNVNGNGKVYHDRYLAEPVPPGESARALLQRVEREAVDQDLVSRPEQWPWCSAGQEILPEADRLPLSALPANALT